MRIIVHGKTSAGKAMFCDALAHGLGLRVLGRAPAVVRDPLEHYGHELQDNTRAVFDGGFDHAVEHYAERDAFRRVFARLVNALGAHTIVYEPYLDVGAASAALVPRPMLPFGAIGSPAARYLLVGERGSNPLSKTTDLAFFGITGSSGYLNYTLAKAGFEEHEIAFVNALRHDGARPEWPKVERVIALGQRAARACTLRGVEHVAIPHPAYWKRFHYGDRTGYVKQLEEVRLS